MKFKTEKGVQVQLSEADIMQISKHNKSQFDSGKLTDYFHEIKEHAVKKLQHISERMIIDQKDVYNNLACVMKHGTYQDAAHYIKYAVDYDIAKHILESMD